ncbi:MAG: GvpL/GvpF family gas vesicle protein [Vicinamibacterales bacterium]
MSRATYVYCAVASSIRPAPSGLRGLPRTGEVRLLDVDRGLWLVVADAPLATYGEAHLAARLGDLRWVSRAAVAHDRVVEAFRGADAVLPMKLLTLFASDERALQYAAEMRETLDRLVTRVKRHDEWGLRLTLGSPHRPTARGPRAAASTASTVARAQSGAQYLARKKAARDEGAERTARGRTLAEELCASLARHASAVRRRGDDGIGADGRGRSLLLDAAMLVPRAQAARFSAAAARRARALAPDGFDLVLTGPWPPYSFMKD